MSIDRWLVALVFLVPGCTESAAESALTDTPAEDSEGGAADLPRASSLDAANFEDAAADIGPLASFTVTLGTGRKRHVSLVDGDTLYLELGHQGLQHVLVSIRGDGLAQDRHRVEFTLTRADGVAVSQPANVSLPFAALPDGSGAQLLGYQLVIVDPALGVGHSAVLRVGVHGPEDELAVDERTVQLQWAPDGWDPDAAE